MRKSTVAPIPTLSVRIDLAGDARIGPGKIQLLENIEACGSISAAARAMDMSYKRAWDLVDEINRICRQAAVKRQTGGRNGGGGHADAVWRFAGRALSQDRAGGHQRGAQGA